MSGFDGKAFGEFVVEQCKAFLERALDPLLAQLAALQQLQTRDQNQLTVLAGEVKRLQDLAASADARLAEAVRAHLQAHPPAAGKDAEPVSAEQLRDAIRAHLAAFPPLPGKDAEPVSAEQLQDAVRAHLEAHPPPPGKDAEPVTPEQLQDAVRAHLEAHPPAAGSDAEPVTPEQLQDAVRAHLEAHPPPPGKDADPVTPEQLQDAVRAYLEAHPPAPGKDAEPVTPEQLQDAVRAHLEAHPPAAGRDAEPITAEQLAAAVDAHLKANPPAPGRDGIGLAGAVIDRAGALVLTLTDGSMRDLGPVVGRDVDMQAVKDDLASLVAALPAPRDGVDGIGFDDLHAEMKDDGRTLRLSFTRSEIERSFELALPVMVYRGVHRDGHAYARGDTVTWAGALWHCNADTDEKPGDGSPLWTLAARKGRDGKDGVLRAARAERSVVKVPAAAAGPSQTGEAP